MAELRAIIHVDMDAFYASIEQRDHPHLSGQPVIVGGTGCRGVVSAASYEARRFGVHSAMPTGQARRLCPDGHFLPVRMNDYREVSAQIFQVFHEVTPLVEGLSLDEAFLDVTGSQQLFGDITEIGKHIKARVKQRTGLTASVGMAPNKLLAKIASDLEKPDGFCLITPDNRRAILDPMPVSKLWGIGKKAAARLQQQGIHTIGELRRATDQQLRPLLGKQLPHFRQIAMGADDRPVVANGEEKSVGSEITFDRDISDPRQLQRSLLEQTELVSRRLRGKQLKGHTITVKIRTHAFITFTRSHSFTPASHHGRTLYQTATALLEKWLADHPAQPLRLLGVAVSNFDTERQLNLFEDAGEQKAGKLDQVMDSIHQQFGHNALKPGALLGKKTS